MLLGFVVPEELAVYDGVSEGEKVGEDLGVDGVSGRERAGHVSAGALVGEYPEVELGEEACEVWETSVWW